MDDIVVRLRDGLTREQVATTGIVPALWGQAADEIERLRAELDTWKSVFPDIAPDAVLPSRTAEIAAAIAAERERCLAICKANRDVFASEQYATGQPISSIGERFACDEIAAAIRGDTTE